MATATRPGAVDPAVGLSATEAADRLDRDGPNALPVEKAVPGWKRLLQQYRSYMQIILVGAAIVSLAIKEWITAVLLSRSPCSTPSSACGRRARPRAP